MKKICTHILLLLLVALGFSGMTSCHRVGAQRPSIRNGHRADEGKQTEALALLTLNQRLSAEADKEILAYVEAQEERYAQMQVGAWVHYLIRTDDETMPQDDEKWTMHMTIRDLDGKLLLDSEPTIRIGHEDLPVAVDAILREMHHGESVRIICPWYTAYGVQGTEQVGAYKNVIIDLQLK